MTARQQSVLIWLVPVVLALLAVAVSWGAFGERVSDAEEDIKVLEEIIPEIREDVAVIRGILEERDKGFLTRGKLFDYLRKAGE